MGIIRRICILVFVLSSISGLSTVVYADNFEIKLGSGNAFEVQDSSGTSLMNVLSSGNVGIGKTNPQSALHVSGYIQLDVLTTSPPPSADCDEAKEVGRMKFDTINNLLFICSGRDGMGWITK